MAKRNTQLKNSLENLKPKENLVAVQQVPKTDTVNISGFAAYQLSDWQKLYGFLTTLKLEPQYYKSVSTQVNELKELIDKLAGQDLELLLKLIIFSRCESDGMRTVSHVATAFVLKHLSGNPAATKFLSSWDKKEGKGGVVFRPDDMARVIEYLTESGNKIPNSVRKAFARNIENFSNYQLGKYTSDLIDVVNLVHPNPEKGPKYNDSFSISHIMTGGKISIDTWEKNNSEAGQEVAKAVKEGKVSQEEAKKLLDEAKNENWKGMLTDGTLGIKAACMNIRNILKLKDPYTVGLLCNLLSNGEKIRQGKVLPHELDVAYEVVLEEFDDALGRSVLVALQKGYEAAIPNLAEQINGRTCVFVDTSGSMRGSWGGSKKTKRNPIDRAMLIAATFAKASNVDIVFFDTSVRKVSYSPNLGVFDLAKDLLSRAGSGGGTDFSLPWRLITNEKSFYDRIVIVSDNECNRESAHVAYKSYLENVAQPYIYQIDLASYGTVQYKGDKVKTYFGSGYQWMLDILKGEIKFEDIMAEIKEKAYW
jgi:hypothetical protein